MFIRFKIEFLLYKHNLKANNEEIQKNQQGMNFPTTMSIVSDQIATSLSNSPSTCWFYQSIANSYDAVDSVFNSTYVNIGEREMRDSKFLLACFLFQVVSSVNIIVQRNLHGDFLENAWSTLCERYENAVWNGTMRCGCRTNSTFYSLPTTTGGRLGCYTGNENGNCKKRFSL